MNGILKTHSKDLNSLLKITDPIILLSIYVCLIWRSQQLIFFPYFLIIISFFLISTFFNNSKLYMSYRRLSLSVLLRRILYAWSSSLLFIIFLFSYADIPTEKDLVIKWFIFGFIYLVISHLFTRKFLKKMRLKGRNSRNIVFWGDSISAINLFNQIQNNRHLGYKFYGWVSNSKEKHKLPKYMPQQLGNDIKDLKKIDKDQVDQLLFGSFDNDSYSMDYLLTYFGDLGIPIGYAPNWAKIGMSLSADNIGNQPFLDIWICHMSSFDKFLKRCFDILFSLLFLIISSPVMIIAAIFIYLETKDDIFFKQRRSGLHGKSFLIYKFRTMKTKDEGDKINLKQAVKNDSRITKTGKYLREWSIDELPQFFNVLKGDMSIVGPRPHAIQHNQKYRNIIPGYMQRHLIKPGITGLAQVKGLRGETSNSELMRMRVESDLTYQQNWSILLDCKIICKTILKLKSSNAY